MTFKPQDYYFQQAQKEWFKARSVFKLKEIDEKYRIFDKSVKTVLDIGCAPGSWLQYVQEKLSTTHGWRLDQQKNTPHWNSNNLQKSALWAEHPKDAISPMVSVKSLPYTLIGLDIKDVILDLPGLYTYNQDIQDQQAVEHILQSHNIKKFDAIISDMAPNTIWFRDIDAIRSIELLYMTLPLYENFLKEGWKAVIKIFMGPGFDKFIQDFKKIVGSKNVKTFKPQAVRKESKEIYIVKY